MSWHHYKYFLAVYFVFNVSLIVHTVTLTRAASKACGDKERVTWFHSNGLHAVCKSADGQLSVTEKFASW